MATKRYAEVMERAIDDEIAALVAVERAAQQRNHLPIAAPAPAYPMPQAAPPTGGAKKESPPAAAAPAPPPPMMPAPAAPSPSYGAAPTMPTPEKITAGIDQRVSRLMQIREWISEDSDIARLLDTVIGNQVRASERRQVRINIAFNVLFLLIGWALSIFASPQAMSALLHLHL
jgi:hypothetical protein